MAPPAQSKEHAQAANAHATAMPEEPGIPKRIHFKLQREKKYPK